MIDYEELIGPIEQFALRRKRLAASVLENYGRDPWLETPHPATIQAITDAVMLMCEVSKRRPKRYKDEPWLTIEPYEHMFHAVEHGNRAYFSITNRKPIDWLDEDSLPHAAHAMLRLAFVISRYEKERDGEAK
jgi:hypothetical protein